MTSVIFSAFLCLDFAIERKFQDLIPANIKNTLIFLVLFSGLATLIVTGHHGASLVYNQGAAVQIPSPNECDALKNLGQ